ncbi:MAG: helix-turn-helix transcriptional regulator [Oscillospiraceae bacterium]|nr:helix-turn-helix transcriptional regulator [Oscillospiraceae bacterium]
MTFGQRLHDLRILHGMTQQELADKSNIARSTLGMYEQDRRHPDFDALDALADLFDVSFDYLLGRSEENNGYPRHGDAALARRLTAYASRIMTAYEKASPDTQAAVRAILHVED